MYSKDSVISLFRNFHQLIRKEELLSRLQTLSGLEYPQTSPAQERAAEYTFELLKKDDFFQAELLKFPADGKTVFHDKIMPLCWDISKGKLSLLSTGEILADYEQNSFAVVSGSTATPPEGINTKIITESQMLAGEDPTGALIMLPPSTRPCNTVLRPLLDLGAIGFVSDNLSNRYQSPDACQWVNGCTDAGDWHVTLEDRDFIGFSVSPKIGDKIRSLAEKGICNVHVLCDAKRYAGDMHVVTGLIPGKQKKEFWIAAHLYEPLMNDDSTGVTAAVEIAKMIRDAGQPEYSIRVIFAHELYGFAAYAASLGQYPGENVVGGCNLDDLASCQPGTLKLVPAGEAVPFHGNEILKECYQALNETVPGLDLESVGQYYDDLALGDSTVGIPLTWLMGKGKFWHNSVQCSIDYIDKDIFFRTVAFSAVYISLCANTLAETVSIAKTPPAPEKHTPLRDYAAQIVFKRKTVGFPFSLAKIPHRNRPALPDGMIYGPFANLLANMDGAKNMAEIILETEGERKTELNDGQIQRYLRMLNVLEKYGYLEAVKRPELNEEDIIAALKKLGITRDDVLLVHASSSKCGFIRGGAETVVDCICKTAGTALFTTFTNPYIFLGGVNKAWSYRPFSPENIRAIWTGKAGRVLLEKYPEAIRSRHITHSWTGVGPLAEECLSVHGPTDPPCGETSPLAKALERNGKVLYFGTTLAPSTFLHYLEDQVRSEYLDTAVCKVKVSDGTFKTVTIERHLPGHRDFYTLEADNRKFFTKAVAAGLEVKSVQLGLAKLQLIDLKQFYEIGMKLLKEEPDILLCDSEKCLFCSKFRKKKQD